MSVTLPTLRQLRFLTALAHHGNFSKAAESCFVTQPTLSAGVKELEGILGVVLVERSARGASLTPAGIDAVERARGILMEAEELVQAAKASCGQLTGSFRLGVIPTIAPFLLPRVLPSIREAFPKLELYLREDLSERIVEALKDRQLDAAVIALPFDMTGIETEIITGDELVFACALEHPAASHSSLTPEDLPREDLLLLEDGHCLRDHALAVCSVAPSDPQNPRSDFGATSLHTLIQMVRNGLGVTLVPQLGLDGGLTEGLELCLRPFDPPVIGREIGMIWRKGSSRCDEIGKLTQVIRDEIGDL